MVEEDLEVGSDTEQCVWNIVLNPHLNMTSD